jgi:hypothetical protein
LCTPGAEDNHSGNKLQNFSQIPLQKKPQPRLYGMFANVYGLFEATLTQRNEEASDLDSYV